MEFISIFAIKRSKRSYANLVALFILVFFMGQIYAQEETKDTSVIQGLYEPSGVVQLSDNQLLTVEDESVRPFVLVTKNIELDELVAVKPRVSVVTKLKLGVLSDLEGVTKSVNGDIYAITSHSRKGNGKREVNREKILRLSVVDGKLERANVRSDFRKTIINAFPELKNASKERNVKKRGGLNIEGLTFNDIGTELLVGLRAPLSNGRAIVIRLLNPHNSLGSNEAFRFAENAIYLDLKGGGIREITYVPALKGYLILSQREDDSDKERVFKLWFLSADMAMSPTRVKVDGIKKLIRTEGLAPVRLNGKEQLILLNDDGDRTRGKFSSYHLVDYTSLRF